MEKEKEKKEGGGGDGGVKKMEEERGIYGGAVAIWLGGAHHRQADGAALADFFKGDFRNQVIFSPQLEQG